MRHTIKKLNEEIKTLARTGTAVGGISDTYHTFDELYEHRVQLFITLCNYLHVFANKDVWKSRQHSDGTMFSGGWFIAGIGTEEGKQITYHIPLDRFQDLHCPELEKAPEWDGHTPEDVLKRLAEL